MQKISLGSSSSFVFHHLGYLVEDINAAAELFSMRFGFQIESDVILDEGQTAEVRLIRQPLSTSWIELITPSCPECKLSMALEKGITLHHVCYEVASFDEAVRLLRETNYFLLSQPEPSAAFSGRRIMWFMSPDKSLVEILEAGECRFSVRKLILHLTREKLEN